VVNDGCWSFSFYTSPFNQYAGITSGTRNEFYPLLTSYRKRDCGTDWVYKNICRFLLRCSCCLFIFRISAVCLLVVSVAKWSHSDKKIGIPCIVRTSAPCTLSTCKHFSRVYVWCLWCRRSRRPVKACVRVEWLHQELLRQSRLFALQYNDRRKLVSKLLIWVGGSIHILVLCINKHWRTYCVTSGGLHERITVSC
jgi:hypothetical protein